MSASKLLHTVIVLALLHPGVLQAADWVAAKVTQPSQFTIDKKTWQPVKQGMTVPNQSWIATGPRGRVILERAKDRVTFQPGTLAGVFEKQGFAIHTEFAQQTGRLELSIDPKVVPHLSVQTPFLAAVVKGTVFTVSVTTKGAKVGVDRGRVEVTDPRSGERTGVHAGQSVNVDTDPDTSMSLSGPNKDFEPIVHVTPTEPKVPRKDIADVADTADNGAAGKVAESDSSNGKKQSDKSSGKSSNGANSGSGDSRGAGESEGKSGSGNGHSGDGGNGSGSGKGGDAGGNSGNSGGKGRSGGSSGHGGGDSGGED